MAVVINGSTGIDKVQDGTITSADLASGVGGKVLQVVSTTYETRVTSSSTTYVDTGLSASITPSSTSSKILVTFSHTALDKRTNSAYMQMRMMRDSTILYYPNKQLMFTGNSEFDTGACTFSYLDSPSTTSSITYKTMFKSDAGNAQVSCQWSGASSVILMEIAG